MVDNNTDFVALFIDWDNMAISIAADLGGATPDVKRLVQTAQNYGTVLVARAYAEWNSTSDRLNLYRAGVEPVYAPTFRFEPDPITQAARGKSLADPCMVADCVDILHLLPKVTTFVIVSGDKDLIPVVRLAQLRGKRVVVIGPDYAAGVLREIADEFISYRSVIESGNGRLAELPPADIPKSAHRRAPVRAPQPSQPGPVLRRGHPAGMPQPLIRPKTREVSSIEPPEPIIQQPVAEIVEPTKAEAAPESKEAPYELSTVFSAVVDIVRQRTGEGKPRLRATNLKDALMVRLPGFNERKYGFAKFKDFLLAGEKTGAISVSVAGPVHWVSLPPKHDERGDTAGQAVIAQEPPAAAEAVDVASATESQYADIVRFVIDLRSRSKWLTYTYVLTNLISFLSRLVPQADAEAAARSILNRLVQEGLLRIDREPQEVEVGGIKHKVRMCHIEENHPFVLEMLSSGEAVKELAETQLVIAEDDEPLGAQDEAEEFPPTQTDRQDVLGTLEASEPETGIGSREPQGTLPLPFAVEIVGAPVATSESVEPSKLDETTPRPPEAAVEPTISTENLPAFAPQPEIAAQPEPAPYQQGPESVPYGQGIEVRKGGTTDVEHGAEPTSALVGLSMAMSLEEAFAAVDKVLRQSSSSGKPRVRLTGLKAKLTGELGHFDEQIYGFKRFKDFLLAAERGGWIKLEASGPVVWVTSANQPKGNADGQIAGEADQAINQTIAEPSKPEPGETKKRSRPSRRRSQPKAPEVLVER